MEIISHRGLWTEAPEKNSQVAMQRSFEAGFGTETDIRDFDRTLVISHDPASADAMSAKLLFKMYRRRSTLTLALNVKADGLQSLISELLQGFPDQRYFLFDMSVPDMLAYRRQGLIFFTRQSEFEMEPALYGEAAGVWLDCFLGEWYDEALIRRHFEAGKRVCVVSAELHGRDHLPAWERLRGMAVHQYEGLLLCTDYPLAAKEYFQL